MKVKREMADVRRKVREITNYDREIKTCFQLLCFASHISRLPFHLKSVKIRSIRLIRSIYIWAE